MCLVVCTFGMPLWPTEVNKAVFSITIKLVIPNSYDELVPETKIRDPLFQCVVLETTWTMHLKLDATPPTARQTTYFWYANACSECVFVHVFTWVDLSTIQRGVISCRSRKKNKVRDRILPRGPGCRLDENGRKGNHSYASSPMSSSRKQKSTSTTKHNSLINPVP